MFVLLIILHGLLSSPYTNAEQTFSISFPSFDSSSCGNGSNLICMGSVTAGNGSLSLTPGYQPKTNSENLVGRVLYGTPVLSWPASFSTTFIFRILTDPKSTGYGDGMTLILAQDTTPPPQLSFGSFIGIFNQSTEGVLHQLAIEFDTFKNEWDPDANHIAVDTVSVEKPIAIKSLNSTGIQLVSGKEITARIEYDGWTKNLQIYVAYSGQPLVSFLNHTMKLKGKVPRSVYVGFTAATGTYRETHQILSWNFTSISLPESSLGRGKNLAVIITIPLIIGLLLLSILAFPFVRRYHRRQMEIIARILEIEGLIAAANGPKIFSYRQLSKATNNFSKENLLGTGGFGSVYKGLVSKPPLTIAVKRISATSKQGEKEYLAEICTIGRLRHKNLLQLQGWCHDRDELLLVYEYMPNGSLDRFIGKNGNFLDWETRYKIILGLASALVYLHEECGNPVVHRDVKPNNVMLNSDFNAHLGDFGLARLLQNEAPVTTLIAGTPGYLAPEVSFTGKATPECDVYSFGMVVLEVVCGKRSRGFLDDNSLVENVWSLYEKHALLDCVDKALEGKYDEEQVRRTLVVGLACLHPDFMLRPRMRKVVQIFMNSEEPLMKLPASKPTQFLVSFNYSSASTTTEFDSKNLQGEVSTETVADQTSVHYQV